MVPQAPLVLPSLRQGTTAHCVSNCTFFLYIQFYILPLQTKALAAPEAPLNSTQITNIHINTRHHLTIVLQTCHNDKDLSNKIASDNITSYIKTHSSTEVKHLMAATSQKRNEALAKSKQEKCACKKKEGAIKAVLI